MAALVFPAIKVRSCIWGRYSAFRVMTISRPCHGYVTAMSWTLATRRSEVSARSRQRIAETSDLAHYRCDLFSSFAFLNRHLFSFKNNQFVLQSVAVRMLCSHKGSTHETISRQHSAMTKILWNTRVLQVYFSMRLEITVVTPFERGNNSSMDWNMR